MGGEITQADRIEGVALNNNAPLGLAELRWLAFLALAIVAFIHAFGFEYVSIAFPAALVLFCLLFPRTAKMLGGKVDVKRMQRDGKKGVFLAFSFASKLFLRVAILFAALAILCVVDHIAVRFGHASDWARQWAEMAAPLTLSLFPLFEGASSVDLGRWAESGRMGEILPVVHGNVAIYFGAFFAHVALYVGVCHFLFGSLTFSDVKSFALWEASYNPHIMDIGNLSFRDIYLYHAHRGSIPTKDVSAKMLRRFRVFMVFGALPFVMYLLFPSFMAKDMLLGDMSARDIIFFALLFLFAPFSGVLVILAGRMFFMTKPREWATLK